MRQRRYWDCRAWLLESAGIFQTRFEELASGLVRVSCSSQGSNYGEKRFDGGNEVSREGEVVEALYVNGT